VLAFVHGLIELLKSIVVSLKATLLELEVALRRRSGPRLLVLLSEGSPLESLIDSTLSVVFWVLIFAPVILVPAFYLLFSITR